MRNPLLILLTALLLAGFGTLLGATPAAPILGQVVSQQAIVDGIDVPSGTTLLSGSEVGTALFPASIHLNTGQVIEVARHSKALLEKNSNGEIQVSVRAGTVSFREGDGKVTTLSADDNVFFSQRRAGQPVVAQQDGVTAVLIARAEEGSKQIRVNDASRVQPTDEILLRSRDGLIQEVTCRVEFIQDNVITLSDPLELTFEPDDLVIQRLKVGRNDVYSTLARPAGSGDDILIVEDATRINPLERIILRSLDGRTREVACVDYTRQPDAASTMMFTVVLRRGVVSDSDVPKAMIKLTKGLQNAFSEGAHIVQGLRVGEQSQVTSLTEKVSKGQRSIRVQEPGRIDPLQQAMIRSSDGSLFEAYCIYSVEGDRVILAEDLDHDYGPNAQIVQGRSAEELIARGLALQRTATCCCCCGGVQLAGGFPWWWLLAGAGATGAGVTTTTTGQETPPSLVAPPVPPIAPNP